MSFHRISILSFRERKCERAFVFRMLAIPQEGPFYLKAITSVEHLIRPFHLTVKRAITYLHNVPAKEYKV